VTEKLGTYNTLYKVKCDENLTVPAYLAMTLLPFGNLTLTRVISW
jgi:hypothetical protein